MKLSPVEIPPRPKGLRIEALAIEDPRFEIDAQAATISVFDVIGLDVTAARIAGALRAIGDKPVTVQINSPGGNAFDGLAIFNLLRGHTKPVTVQVLGLAASAASIVAMAGDTIQIARAAQIMIHRAQGGAMGDADMMRTMAGALDKVDSTIAGVYQARTGLPAAQVADMMAAETFMSSDDALAWGFADALLDRDAAPAPRVAAAATPQSKRELEEQFRQLGFSRSVAARMTGAAWDARQRENDIPALDLSAVAEAMNANFRVLKPYT